MAGVSRLQKELEELRRGGLALGAEQQGQEFTSFPPGPAEHPEWTLPIKRFSASSFSLLQECPRAWQQRYLLDKRAPSHERQVLGRAFHSAIEFNWRCKMHTDVDLPAHAVKDFFVDEAWAKAEEGDEITWEKGKDFCISLGCRLIDGYLAQVPEIIPEYTEKELVLEVEGIPVPIIGIADCIQVGNRPIIDLKTAARGMSTPKTQWKMQGWIYQMATGKPFIWHVITKTKEPTLIVLPEREPPVYAKQHFRYLANTANMLYNTYGTEDWPATGIGHDWACKSCFYKGDCPAWA